MKLLIKNAKFFENDLLVKKDILIENKIIKKISQMIEVNEKDLLVYEANNKFITPGLIDVHVHTREPGYEYKEDLKSVTRSALVGGVTTFCAMANLNPVPDNVEDYLKIKKMIKEKSFLNIFQMCAATKKLNSDELVDFESLSKAGAKYFSNDGFGIQKKEVMKKILKQIKKTNSIISIHLETESIKKDGYIDDCSLAKKYNLNTFSQDSEVEQLKRDIELLKDINCNYHVGHLTTKKSIDLIREHKKSLNITCEVTPNHLILQSEMFNKNSGLFRINPPIRKEEDRLALIKGLQDGTIDCIATDHAPHHWDEKNVEFDKANFGMIGLDFSFSILYTELVKKNLLSLSELIKKMHSNPNKIFNLKQNIIAEKENANLVVWDLEEEFEINENFIKSKSKNTPFLNKKLFGKNKLTIFEGEIKWKDD
ncbi:dihydroorotase [Spiroplasma tabanidicola]|uniref:Dihydroorotase n=1 Tax=Spiroplasma tabanidicola TaxID=324079 RepID=A0A6I6C764_9MOLU|nr:dihydroorotase [Spiroplasma tabanidicola]QGS52050.1 dihydroorotase [Spiroplasma tabanidicola]